MEHILPTVMITTKNGPVRINETDYDEKKHKLHKPSGKDEKEAMNAEPKTVDQTGQIDPNLTIPVAPSAPNFASPPTAPVAPSNPSPSQRLVTKQGKKFVVVDMNGAKIEANGIDQTGYATEAEAWTAALAPATQDNPANAGARDPHTGNTIDGLVADKPA